MQDDFPPPYQFFIAGAALNGDKHGQREALEVAVAMSDAGVSPIPLLRLAVLESLRTALDNNRVPIRRESSSTSPPDGVGLRIAVEWWKLYETDERSRKAMSTVLQSQLKDIPGFKGKEIPLSNISRALKTHGNSGKGLGGVARGVALFELAWTPEGPTDWLDPYQPERHQSAHHFTTPLSDRQLCKMSHGNSQLSVSQILDIRKSCQISSADTIHHA